VTAPESPEPTQRLLSPDGLAYWDGTRWVSLVSPDGSAYWNGHQWVRLPRQRQPDKDRGGPSVLSTLLVAAVLVAGSVWILNNTRVGVSIKCQVLGDAFACLSIAFDQAVTPPQFQPRPVRTESPEEAARRQHEEQVASAVQAVRTAVAALDDNATELVNTANQLTADAADVEAALSEMRPDYDALQREVDERPMDSFQRDEVCFALDDVGFARDDVGFSVDAYGFDLEFYQSASSDRPGLESDLDSVIGHLLALVGSSSEQSTLLSSASSAAADAAMRSETAAATKSQAAANVAASVAASDEVLRDARKLAATVADCP
jgi:hypothetical protein